MARVISFCLPMWPIDRRQRQADSTPSAEAPLILAGRLSNRRVVTAACEVAVGLGLNIGMPVSQAQALVPDLRVEQAVPRADLEALERLSLWLLQRISPIVAVDPPDNGYAASIAELLVPEQGLLLLAGFAGIAIGGLMLLAGYLYMILVLNECTMLLGALVAAGQNSLAVYVLQGVVASFVFGGHR